MLKYLHVRAHEAGQVPVHGPRGELAEGVIVVVHGGVSDVGEFLGFHFSLLFGRTDFSLVPLASEKNS